MIGRSILDEFQVILAPQVYWRNKSRIDQQGEWHLSMADNGVWLTDGAEEPEFQPVFFPYSSIRYIETESSAYEPHWQQVLKAKLDETPGQLRDFDDEQGSTQQVISGGDKWNWTFAEGYGAGPSSFSEAGADLWVK